MSKDVPDGPLLREETYDVPPAFAKAKPFDPTRHPLVLAAPPPDSPPPEEVYDVPPPAPDLYDVPPGLRRPGPGALYDVPRERLLPPEAASSGAADAGVYSVPPAAEREAPADAKRLSASSTGSTRSSQSASSLEAAVPGREPLELEVAVEALTRLQQGVSATVAHLLDLAGSAGGCGGRRGPPEPQEPPAVDLRAAVAAVHAAVHELLEFARSAVGNATHTSDRTLHAKLSRQLQKMEDVYQTLVAHGQALESGRGGLGATPEDLDRLVACSRAVPEDAKQLASFLHGNASLLFRRTKASVPGPEGGGPLHPTPADKASSIQSRPLPSPPKFASQDSPDGQYESGEGGWMEDYDYVHLQVGAPSLGRALTPSRLSPPGAGMGPGKVLVSPWALLFFQASRAPGVPPSLSQALGPMWRHHQGSCSAPQGWLPVTCKGRACLAPAPCPVWGGES